MASSRWKRFAFFERQTLMLPNVVLDDIRMDDTPSASLDASTANARGANGVNGATSGSTSIPTRVILAVSTASLPAHTRPSSLQTPSAASPSPSTSVDAVASMWASLTACSATEPTPSAVSTLSTPSNATNATPDTGSLRLASQGQTALPTPSRVTTTILDGLVLAFVASPNSSRIHCVDLTVRCNPPKLARDATTASGTSSATSTAAPVASTAPTAPTTASTTPLTAPPDDMDGWRGYWSPFSTPTRPTVAGTRTTPTRAPEPPTVLAVATCRVPVSTEQRDPNGTHSILVSTSLQSAHSPLHVACLGSHNTLTVWEDPHLHLSCRQPVHDTSPSTLDAPTVYTLPVASAASSTPHGGSSSHVWTKWNVDQDGTACALDIVPGLVAVGTDHGVLLLLAYAGTEPLTRSTAAATATSTSAAQQHVMRPYVRIPAPPATGMRVVSVQLSVASDTANVFVVYNRVVSTSGLNASTGSLASSSTAGICCYDLPLPSRIASGTTWAAPLARHDLDGRYVSLPSLVDSYTRRQGEHTLTVARPDGLYSYSHTERTGVAPIDGSKLAICVIPPPVPAEKVREVDLDHVGSGYALVASTDTNSGRDVVDIYDSTNKLVAFHLLLSPGHRASCAAGVTTLPARLPDGSIRGGRSSAVVLTTGGALVTFTEKLTDEKIALLVQKHLYSAAIVVAYADPSYEASDITALYQNYAEYLYRKGDFSGAIEQYMHTIGSLESSHVIFRYLDAPKIPLLVRYLEKLRSKERATPVHNELLRTCYLKLNDVQAAEAIAISTSWSVTDASLESILSNLSVKPKDALATICSLDAHQAAEVLAIHGASLARVLPRETAGVVIALCLGSYSPKALAEASMADTLGEAAATITAANAMDLNKMVNTNENPQAMIIDPYPVALFASAFVEHPKLLRLLLAHCNRNKCPVTPSLRRALLELTLAEWNQAKRCGDTEVEKLRHKEAIAYLTDSHCHDIGDCDALVIVELAGFQDGALLLYERQQLIPFLLERYSKDGSDKARRQMLAMCNSDPDVLADVLGYFVEMYSREDANVKTTPDDGSDNDETSAILDDIQEALTLARKMNIVPVRIARILAGEGSGQFTSDRPIKERRKTVPLHVALDYVASVLEKSRKESFRLRSEIEEYNQLCNAMENEIDSLLRASFVLPTPKNSNSTETQNSRLNIDNLLAKVKSDEGGIVVDAMTEQAREAFWREMIQSDDNFETIARFFAKGVIG